MNVQTLSFAPLAVDLNQSTTGCNNCNGNIDKKAEIKHQFYISTGLSRAKNSVDTRRHVTLLPNHDSRRNSLLTLKDRSKILEICICENIRENQLRICTGEPEYQELRETHLRRRHFLTSIILKFAAY